MLKTMVYVRCHYRRLRLPTAKRAHLPILMKYYTSNQRYHRQSCSTCPIWDKAQPVKYLQIKSHHWYHYHNYYQNQTSTADRKFSPPEEIEKALLTSHLPQEIESPETFCRKILIDANWKFEQECGALKTEFANMFSRLLPFRRDWLSQVNNGCQFPWHIASVNMSNAATLLPKTELLFGEHSFYLKGKAIKLIKTCPSLVMFFLINSLAS